jgi:hypothetical protein
MENQNNFETISKEISEDPFQSLVLKTIAKDPYIDEENKGKQHIFGGTFHRAKEQLLRKQLIKGHGGFTFSLTELGQKLFNQDESLV